MFFSVFEKLYVKRIYQTNRRNLGYFFIMFCINTTIAQGDVVAIHI
jgi:hypothetical protein